ncbi:MAG: hypothetical protein K2J79_07140, partial [Ruminiclostridium sp.]|nr:hypothetical protein [Ruminiclostridium sp.]
MESNDIDFGEHTELTSVSENISEITQVTEDPDEITYGDPVIGGNAILSQDTLDNLTASLIIRDISHLPDDTERGDYYGGRFIVVQLKDNKSGAVVENILPKESYIFGSLYSGSDERIMVIDAECAANSVKLFCIENNGKKEYILKVEYLWERNDMHLSSFACCDMSRYSEEKAYLKWYTEGEYSNDNFFISPDFDYKSGNVFLDRRAETEYEFDTENLKVTESGMDPADIVFGEPEIGKNSILSQDTFGEYTAVLEVHNITGMPEKDSALYGKTYVGDKLYLKLEVNNNVIAYGSLPNGLVSEYSVAIPEKCTGEGSTRMFTIEQNEKTYYLVMQYCMYDKESDSIGADFACFDPEVYEQYREFPNEAVFPLIWYSMQYSGLV